MNARQVSRFFSLLARRFPHPCRIILTGAAAGAIYGRVRATMDIDFAVRLTGSSSRQKEKRWQELEQALREVTILTGIAVQYAEDIDRWSSITFLDYEKHTALFEKFGKIEIRILDPCYWAIGKMARYLDPDIRDLLQVLHRAETSWSKLAGLLGRALKESPKSTACTAFRRQVEDFFSAYGRRVWGPSFSAERAIGVFCKNAGIRESERRETR